MSSFSVRKPSDSQLDSKTTQAHVRIFSTASGGVSTERLREFVAGLDGKLKGPFMEEFKEAPTDQRKRDQHFWFLRRPQSFSCETLEDWAREAGHLDAGGSGDEASGEEASPDPLPQGLPQAIPLDPAEQSAGGRGPSSGLSIPRGASRFSGDLQDGRFSGDLQGQPLLPGIREYELRDGKVSLRRSRGSSAPPMGISNGLQQRSPHLQRSLGARQGQSRASGSSGGLGIAAGGLGDPLDGFQGSSEALRSDRKHAASPDGHDLSNCDSRALAAAFLDKKLVSVEAAHAFVESGVVLSDLSSMSRADWAELFPTFVHRNRVQRYLRACNVPLGFQDRAPESRSSPAVQRSAAELRRLLRRALEDRDWDLAKVIRSELMQSAEPRLKSRARRCSSAWGERLRQAQGDLDIEACRKYDEAIRLARQASHDGASEDDLRRFLAVEEQVRADAASPPRSSLDRQRELFRRAREAADVLGSRDEPATRAVPTAAGTFSMLPAPKGSTAASGAESVKSLFEMADVNEKVEPAHALERISESHARTHAHVRLSVPHGYEAAMDWLDAAQAKCREGNAHLSEEQKDSLLPPHREVMDLPLTGKEMIRRVRSSLQQDSLGPVEMGHLALVVAHCAIHGALHFDHFFDRERHGHLVSPSVMNAVDQCARDHQKYLDLRTKITLEQKLAKDGWLRKVFPGARSEATQPRPVTSAAGISEGRGKTASSSAITWTPSAGWDVKAHPLDKAAPSLEKMRVMRGYYEAIGAANGAAPCKCCGLPHDMNKTTCHWHKFPNHRSKAFRKGYALALKNGYFTETEIDEWNGRAGREITHRCDSTGRHTTKPTLVDLRGGVGGQ